ncbi:MAG: hypothetical protein Q8R83_10245 [Legionellaceae bacterium]|nr:hypothetical protein [Legionellaceae bacterium]
MLTNFNSIQNTLLKEIESGLRSGWMHARKVDIDEHMQTFNLNLAEKDKEQLDEYKRTQDTHKPILIEDERQRLKRKIAELEAAVPKLPGKKNTDFDRHESFEVTRLNSELNSVETTISNRLTQLFKNQESAIRLKTQNKITQEQKQITDKYDKEFTVLWDNTFKSIFTAQFQAFSPMDIQRQLLERHPWLDKDVSNNNHTLITHFLIEKLRCCFIECLTEPRLFSWSSIDVRSHRRFTWKAIAPLWLTQTIQGYPLSNQSFYDNRELPTSLPAPFSRGFTRFDCYRLIISQYRGNFLPRKCHGEIYCTEIAPMHHTELTTLSVAEKNTLQTILVNTATEDEPAWILLHKRQNNWTLYLPKFLEKNTTVLDRAGWSYAIEYVNYTNNSSLSDMSLSPLVQWHAVLLARVLPWCRSPSQPTLLQYRAIVPVTLLLQSVLEATCTGSQKDYKTLSEKAFANRAPFSVDDAAALYYKNSSSAPKKPEASEHLLKDLVTLVSTQSAAAVMNAFDLNLMTFSDSLKRQPPQFDTIMVSHQATLQQLNQALKLIYHHGISRLEVSKCAGVKEKLKDSTALVRKLVEYDLQLTTIISSASHRNDYEYLFYCAARNRFLARVKTIDSTVSVKTLITSRQGAWSETGKYIVEFFQNNPLDLAIVKHVIAFNKTWRQQGCVNECRPSSEDSIVWPFVQIAQMGVEGLNVLFQQLTIVYVYSWNPTYKEPAPNLSCTFDLNGSLFETPTTYITHLTTKIKEFSKNGSSTCAPLFTKLGLILPDQFDVAALVDLIQALHERKTKYADEIEEVVLYNLVNPSAQSRALITTLTQLAASLNTRLQVSICIPEWDIEAYDDVSKGSLKADYKALQNQVKNNIRYARHKELNTNTQAIYDYARGELTSELTLNDHLAQRSQLWEGKDVIYPLTSESPGIQQQLQRQVIQEVHQEVQQQHETVKEIVREILQYTGDETKLITRETIDKDTEALKHWESIPEGTKQHLGWEPNKTLAELFSLWVGSKHNAEFVIHRIEPAAIRKLMDFSPIFRFGIDWERTPGFSVARSKKDGALILSYSERLEKQDLLKQKQAIAEGKRDPFAVQMRKVKPAVAFRGDYRQFNPFAPQTIVPQDAAQSLQTFWRHCATEDQNPQRLANNAQWLKKQNIAGDAADASVVLQRYHATQQVKLSLTETDQVTLLKAWAKTQWPNSSAFISALFDPFSANDMKALGQLFYHYDIQEKTIDIPKKNTSVLNGTIRWLFIAKQVFDTFPEHFTTWKNRIMEPLNDWSEALDKGEVDALALSMQTLKDNRDYQAILWGLIDAHGVAVGAVSYPEIWYPFEAVLKYLEEHNLVLNKDKFSAYFKRVNATHEFNATQFLRRLHFVLQHVANQHDSLEIQKKILDSIDLIDWGHDGLDYACRREGYADWDALYRFTGLNSLITHNPRPSYTVTWDNIEPNTIEEPIAYAMRYVAKRLKLDQKNTSDFKAILISNERHLNAYDGKPVLRLLTASIALGIDKINELSSSPATAEIIGALNNSKYAAILVQLNDLLRMDQTELAPGTYQVRWCDLQLFLDVLIDNDFLTQFKNQRIAFDLNEVNALGRALHCYAVKNLDQKESLKKLIKYSLHNASFDLPLVKCHPWIIDNVEKTKTFGAIRYNKADPSQSGASILNALTSLFWTNPLDIFKKQLASIDFTTTTYWPTYDELVVAFKEIAANGNNRAKIVADWLKRGCAIVDQGAPFRQLTREEVTATINNKHLKLSAAFKEQNNSLFSCLVPYLAIRVDNNTNLDHQIKPLLALFARLDSKTHYNELGRVLGLLLETARNPKRYYSVEQLTSWLSALFNESEFATKHYPVEFLGELLTDAVSAESSSLLNQNLLYLKKEDDSSSSLRRILAEVAKSELFYQVKKTLVKLAIQLKNDSELNDTYHDVKRLLSPKTPRSWKWENKLCNLVTQLSGQGKLKTHIKTIQILSFQAELSGKLNNLWESTQIKLMDMLAQENITHETIHNYFPDTTKAKWQYTRMIVIAAMEQWDAKFVDILDDKLTKWDIRELQQLAEYYSSKPTPTLSELNALIQYSSLNTAKSLIYHFETQTQAFNKRSYSIAPEDVANIQRVLAGFKLKGKGFIPDNEQKQLTNLLYYTNTYSQFAELDSLPSEKLIELLYSQIAAQKKLVSGDDKNQATARVLACMREVLLRKTGKWANHTQMLDLLYGALHNDESLLHQVRTGEGKSIITVMRVAYRALNGQVVDVFSSKDSLSSRDHEEFGMVFDAFGIRHNHITEKSDASAYHSTVDANGIGAVNYSTIGNWSLFLSGLVWENKANIDLKSPHRVAFLDEGDHIMLDENTQFNFSDKGESNSLYNLDEWVYREAYDFYLAHRETFDNYLTGIPSVHRNHELKALCEKLQESESQMAPKESLFFRNYIIPALPDPKTNEMPSEQALEIRDQQLRQLLTAAHIASGLKENTHFCVMPDQQEVSGGAKIATKFAKVVINNQVYHGSTYSDLVQQFLHVRLNKEAVKQGKTPNFFVEPNSEIALSLNARYVLKNYYTHVEACTGTGGNEADLKVYEEEYNIRRVIKLATHEEIKTEFLPPVYCKETLAQQSARNGKHIPNQAQIAKIVESILANPNQPILITCEDDNAVAATGKVIQDALLTTQGYKVDTDLQDTKGVMLKKFIIDTNNSGRREADILPFTGRKGSVTISSRMGRGTDIKPYDKKVGLRVIRTYPIHPRVAKQEQGRQGRNGANGVCQEILDYDAITKEYDAYGQSREYGARLNLLFKKELEHLNKKLEKHQQLKKQNKRIWAHITENRDDQLCYLRTRALQHLKQQIKQEKNLFIRRKEDLIATATGNVMEVLPQLSGAKERDKIKDTWKTCRKAIDAAWDKRLANKESGDSEAIYGEFFKIAHRHWQSFCTHHPDLNGWLLSSLAGAVEDVDNSTGPAADKKLIKKIKDKWEKKLTDGKLVPGDREKMESDNNLLKKMQIHYHPNSLRRAAVLAKMTPDEATDISRSISDLKALLAEWISKFDQHSVTPENATTEKPPAEKTQRDDMPNVVSFYQAWLTGAQANYFNKDKKIKLEVGNELYGKHGERMSELYKTLEAFSCHNIAFVMDEAKQTARRCALFEKLTVLFNQYPASYSVSSTTWADRIKYFSMATNPNIRDNYVTWLAIFFEAVQTRTPYALKSAREVVVMDLLFVLIPNILEKKHILKNDASVTFIKRFTELMFTRYVDSLDEHFIAIIKNLFARDEQVTELLTLHTNQADLVYILDMLLEHKKNPEFNQNLSAFVTYVNNNFDDLNAKPDCIRPLIASLFKPKQSSFVPAINKLKPLVIAETSPADIVKFLSQRPDYTEEVYDRFVSVISPGLEAHQTMALLSQLPPYVSLNYLIEHLVDVPGKYDLRYLEERIKSISKTAEICNTFMREHGVISATDVFASPPNPDQYKIWIDHFSSMSLAQSQLFFTAMSTLKSSSLDILSCLATAYSKRLVEGATFNQAIDLLAKVQGLPAKQLRFVEAVFKNEFDAATLTNDTSQASITRLDQFVNLISVDHDNLASLYDPIYLCWIQSDYDDDLYTNLSHYIQSIKSLPANDIAFIVWQFEQVKNRGSLATDLVSLNYFVRLLSDNKLNPLSRDELESLTRAWIAYDFKDSFLDDSVAIYKLIAQLEDKTKLSCYRDFYKTLDKNPKNNQRYLELLTALQPHAESLILNTESKDSGVSNILFSRYVTSSEIKTPQDLSQALDVMQRASRLNKNQNYDDYFSAVEKNQLARIQIMQYLNQGLLDFLGLDFKMKCDQKYRTLYNVSTLPVQSIPSMHSVAYQGMLHKWYQGICNFMQELLAITQAPFAANQAKPMTAKHEEYVDYFAKKQATYASFWFTANRSRQTQATSMFQNLNKEGLKKQTLGSYYHQVFKVIFEAQQQIIRNDIQLNQGRYFTNINGKGHSRLYDITGEMLTTLLRDYNAEVASHSISPDEYKQFHEQLKKQLPFHIAQLLRALPEWHGLKTGIQKIERCSVELDPWSNVAMRQSLSNLLNGAYPEVPKHLRHMVENVQCFLDLSKKTPYKDVESLAQCAM